MILETLTGGLLGGALRLAPEVLKWLDRRGDRAHELAMFDKQLEADRMRSQLHVAEINAAGQVALDVSALDALKESIRSQTEMAAAAGGWIAGLSASVRPVVTYALLALYAAAKAAAFAGSWNAGAGWVEIVNAGFGLEDKALLAGVINYWFIDRTLRHRS